MKLNKTIKQSLITLLKEEEIVSSWGISDISIIDNKVSFKVEGFRYKGLVTIFSNGEGLLDVVLDSRSHKNVPIDNILAILDSEIELSDDYINELRCWIEKQITR